MPELTTFAEVAEHLGAALRGEDRWVVVAEDDRGTAILARLGMGLGLECLLMGSPLFGAVFYGSIGFRHRSGIARVIRLLTIPKELVPEAALVNWLRQEQVKVPDDRGPDVFALCASEESREYLTDFLSAAAGGTLQRASSPVEDN